MAANRGLGLKQQGLGIREISRRLGVSRPTLMGEVGNLRGRTRLGQGNVTQIYATCALFLLAK